MCKGADSAILSRLCPETYATRSTSHAKRMRQFILGQMEKYTQKGYRGLLMALRVLSSKEARDFRKRYDRLCELEPKLKSKEQWAFLKDLERDLVLVGGSAVEDKLQDGLRRTIKGLRAAQMKVWVLTGDKMDTAENIAVSSGLFTKVRPNPRNLKSNEFACWAKSQKISNSVSMII